MEATLTQTPDRPLAPIRDRSKRRLVMGHALSAVAVSFLLFDSVIKLVKIAPVVESFERLGYSPAIAREIGWLELACLALYVVPRTAPLGAVLLTGFLGGAIATHVRVGDPLFSHVLFPLYMGVLLWGGLFLRDERLRALFGLPRQASARGAA